MGFQAALVRIYIVNNGGKRLRITCVCVTIKAISTKIYIRVNSIGYIFLCRKR